MLLVIVYQLNIICHYYPYYLLELLTGTWLISGIVPAMIFYGLKILNANDEIFLFASCIICAIVSIASGSSWSTIATIGIALIGILEKH